MYLYQVPHPEVRGNTADQGNVPAYIRILPYLSDRPGSCMRDAKPCTFSSCKGGGDRSTVYVLMPDAVMAVPISVRTSIAFFIATVASYYEDTYFHQILYVTLILLTTVCTFSHVSIRHPVCEKIVKEDSDTKCRAKETLIPVPPLGIGQTLERT